MYLALTAYTHTVCLCVKSYGLHYKKKQQTELLTYVDYVELGGPAHLAGLRPGSFTLHLQH